MSRTFQNPIARNGDFADPFVLKYNGRYYLYGTNPDIRCWSSDNLLDWTLEGPTIEEDTFPTLVPFAPEIVYSNGMFYMYTSPSGLGHYVLESDKPTGPFRKISENIEHAIDGSVFIDDDGSWYFYWAGDEGIWGCEMKSPTEFGQPVLTGATMYGWTEGPFIVKKNGVYYMTYTGNHYLSKGYRINCAWSTHPLKGYQDEVYNPVIIHTQGDVVGLGHSSTVLGPDLVSYYIVYHNMNEDASRDLDIDRQLWYKQASQILGPTRTPMPAPRMPDFAFPNNGSSELNLCFFNGSSVYENGLFYGDSEKLFILSEESCGSTFTAEFNIRIPKESRGEKKGILFGECEKSYYRIVFDSESHSLQLWEKKENVSIQLGESPLPQDYLFETLHCIRVEHKENEFLHVYIDNRLQLQWESLELNSVRIGYFSNKGIIAYGYTALKGTICDMASKDILIPVNTSFYPVFGEGNFSSNPDGSILLKDAQKARYNYYAEWDGEYKLFLSGRISENKTRVTIRNDGNVIGECSSIQGLHSYTLELSKGNHVLEIEGNEGEFILIRVGIHYLEDRKDEHKLLVPTEIGPYGKKLCGNESWSDYEVLAKVSMELLEKNSFAGLLLRVTEPSEGGEGADALLGIHFFIGYSVSYNGREIVIARHRYDRKVLKTCPLEMNEHEIIEMRAQVKGSEITVYINQEQSPRLSVIDTEPITHGCAGIWASNSLLTIKEIDVDM